MKKSILVASSILLLLSGCVPGRQFTAVEEEARTCREENKILKTQQADNEERIKTLEAQEKNNLVKLKGLENDTAVMGSSLKTLRSQYDKINNLNDELMRKQKIILEGSENEKRELLSDLQMKESRLNALEDELNVKSKQLSDREQKVTELQNLIGQQEAASRELKNKVANALMGFKDKGLSVEEKNGRVQVSLEAKLLFASGSDKVDAEGKSALIKLAKVIENQGDISVLVEGHTDTDKIGPSLPYKDNWDLSVMRATSVVRIMLDNSVLKPEILTAAGRSQYLPVDESDKAKNRRIEIVLIPNLDELYKILDAN